LTVGIGDRADPELRKALDRLGEHEMVEVLVYPAGGTDDLLSYLAPKRDTGDLEFNVLQLAGSIVLRARRGIINEVAARSDVARVTPNPRFTTNGAS
jgi:hypothetical protein